MTVKTWSAFSKRRNSTKQPTGGSTKTITLKEPTSTERPVFVIHDFTRSDNYLEWDGRYYFIDDIVQVSNGIAEYHCIIDVLATYKAEILASTQFVSYSASANETWLPDTRIPAIKEQSADMTTVSSALTPYNAAGFYALTATGKVGTQVFIMSQGQIKYLIANINTWANDSVQDILDGSWLGVTYDFSTNELAIESLGKILTQTGVIGNAFANAPQNIRSCIWLPLDVTEFTQASSERLYLGNYDTGMDLPVCRIQPVTDDIDVTIPWQYNDWRRCNESLVLVLPFAGCINIPTDLVISNTKIVVRYSISASDGTVAYLVFSGGGSESGTFIGEYGGSIAGSYAIGINQMSSLGEVVQTIMAGSERTINSLIQTSLSPQSQMAGLAGAGMSGIETMYEVQNVAASTHNTTIGNFGGCASAFLTGGNIYLSSSCPKLVTTPASMAATMGRPLMKPIALSGLTGYCECVNAHIEAAAEASELDALDRYLNTGFYIE